MEQTFSDNGSCSAVLRDFARDDEFLQHLLRVFHERLMRYWVHRVHMRLESLQFDECIRSLRYLSSELRFSKVSLSSTIGVDSVLGFIFSFMIYGLKHCRSALSYVIFLLSLYFFFVCIISIPDLYMDRIFVVRLSTTFDSTCLHLEHFSLSLIL